jgi:ABC-type branched-subunit amino acid transport system permease subunit
VADDHQAAQSIGIPLNRIWVIVWSVAGFVALVAGIIWGSKLGVQFSLSLVALKALPVVILGGLTSVPGAIIGGLIIGVGEKLSEVFIGPMLRRRHRDLVRLRAGAARSCWCGPRGCSARRSSIASEQTRRTTCSTVKTASSRPATAPTSRSSRSAGPHR